MCGLIGVIDRESTKVGSDKLSKFFREGLYCDALRGRHGTGVMGVSAANAVRVYKRALPAADFIDLQLAKDIIDNSNSVFKAGHNRWATMGVHSNENSHPFAHGDITLFHNGTLDFYRSLLPNGVTFQVDSEAIAYLLSEKEAVSVLESLEGAYSLVWYDSTKESLFFARNSERPMYFGTIKDSSSMVYASEEGMIRWLADRNDIQLASVFSTKPGRLIQIPLDKNEKLTTTEFTPKVSTRDYDFYMMGGRSIATTTHYKSQSKQTIQSNKYRYLERLDSVEVTAGTWRKYTHASTPDPFGEIDCKFDNELTITINSIKQSDKDKIEGKKIKVKVTNAYSTNKAFASFVEVVEEKKSQPHLLSHIG